MINEYSLTDFAQSSRVRVGRRRASMGAAELRGKQREQMPEKQEELGEVI